MNRSCDSGGDNGNVVSSKSLVSRRVASHRHNRASTDLECRFVHVLGGSSGRCTGDPGI